MAERSKVQELFARQEAERAEFVRSQIRRLNEAGFGWKLPKDFRRETGYEGKGLITDAHGYYFEVLSPDEGLICVPRDMPNRPVSLLGGGMTGSGIGHLESLERAVNAALAQVSSRKSPLKRLIPRLN